MDIENVQKTTAELLDEQIRKTIDELNDGIGVFTDEKAKPALDKLKMLTEKQAEYLKIQSNAELKQRELDLEQQKLEADTAIRIREVELKESNDKSTREIEEAKLKEQRKANTTQAVIGGAGVLAGIFGTVSAIRCFNKSLRFEETGSFTNKSAQAVGGLFNLFRKK